MQMLTASPRDVFTADQVLAALQADAVVMDAGAELLDFNLNVVDDISADLVAAGSTIAFSSDATPFTTCTIGLARALQWGTDLIRLYVTLDDGQTLTTYRAGVFCLTTPQNQIGSTPTVYKVTGYDRLYLLSREVGDSYSVGAGSSYIASILNVITAAGLTGVQIDSAASAAVLPADMVWPLIPTSGDATLWLDVVNALLDAIAYDPLWCDENGVYRSQPHLDPSTRTPEFTLDADDPLTTIVGQQRTKTEDQWASPNKWIFVQSGFDGAPTEGAGIYTVINQSDGPASVDARGITWVKSFNLDAADQATLMQLGNQQVALDVADTTQIDLATGPLPIAGQSDVLTYIDTDAGVSLKAQATAWTLPLDGGQMTWTIQTT